MNKPIQNLVARRKSLRVTQGDLAKESGVSLSMISKLESGHRENATLKLIEKIEGALTRLEQTKGAAHADNIHCSNASTQAA